MNWSTLLAQDAPRLPDFILIPGALWVLGVAIWWFGWRRERDDGNKMVKWAGLIPLLIAMFLSWDYFYKLIDTGVDGQIFRDTIDNSRKLMYAGYFAFLAPAICVVGFTVWAIVERKMGKYR
jgi:hypothetical protein